VAARESREALAKIGEAASPAVPDLLKLIVAETPADPRRTTQRYVAFCLSIPVTSECARITGGSLEGVDKICCIRRLKAFCK